MRITSRPPITRENDDMDITIEVIMGMIGTMIIVKWRMELPDPIYDG